MPAGGPGTAQADTGGRGPCSPLQLGRGVCVQVPARSVPGPTLTSAGRSGLRCLPGPVFCVEASGYKVLTAASTHHPSPKVPTLSERPLPPGPPPRPAQPPLQVPQPTPPSMSDPLLRVPLSRGPTPTGHCLSTTAAPAFGGGAGRCGRGPHAATSQAEHWCSPNLLEPAEPPLQGSTPGAPQACTPLCLPASAPPLPSAPPGTAPRSIYTARLCRDLPVPTGLCQGPTVLSAPPQS